jgi:glycosyltransferase involved in cell wall biosynthesis
MGGCPILISVVACTKREHMFKNILENFQRQTVVDKELIIVLNKSGMKFEATKDEKVRVFYLDECVTLGECLNFGVSQARFPVIARFDDDDYYAPKYLENSLNLMKERKAEVVGKGAVFVYFKNKHLLTLFRHHMNHTFVNREFLSGATLCFQKGVWECVPFRKLNTGEDIQFQRDCLRHDIRLYSGGFQDFAVIRYGEEHGHTWKVDDETFMNHCRRMAVTENFEDIVGGE